MSVGVLVRGIGGGQMEGTLWQRRVSSLALKNVYPSAGVLLTLAHGVKTEVILLDSWIRK